MKMELRATQALARMPHMIPVGKRVNSHQETLDHVRQLQQEPMQAGDG